jgi:tRNA(fMet)-specific endonuclease VapC
MTFLLDTDTCVFALRGSESVRDRLNAVDPGAMAISVVTLAELYYGAGCSASPEANRQVVDGFASGVVVIGLDGEVARLFGEFKVQLRRRGALIDDLDLLIAATAHYHRLTLITHNLGHFCRLPELQLEDWVRI